MKYAFVTISIFFIWLAMILIIYILKSDSIVLPIVAITMTMALFVIGFRQKKK